MTGGWISGVCACDTNVRTCCVTGIILYLRFCREEKKLLSLAGLFVLFFRSLSLFPLVLLHDTDTVLWSCCVCVCLCALAVCLILFLPVFPFFRRKALKYCCRTALVTFVVAGSLSLCACYNGLYTKYYATRSLDTKNNVKRRR